MPSQKRVKKVRRIKVKNVLIALFILIFICLFITYILTLKIKNIYVLGNDILEDNIIIKDAKLQKYPSFIMTKSSDIKNNLLKNEYIKDVKISKKPLAKVYINITENKALAMKDNKILLENKKYIDNTYNLTYLPTLANDITLILNDFCKYFALVDKSTLNKISQIEYKPNSVDNLRLLLYMNDGNSVYVTLTKIEKINKYNSIKDQLGNNLGILYLDAGDYYEIKN